MFELNLSQLINSSTHVKGNTLDLIITNSYEFVSNVLIDKIGKFSLNSDHYPINFSYTSTPLPSPCPIPFRIYDYSKANLEGLSEFLIEADYGGCLLSTDVEDIWEYLRNIIHDGMNKFIPKLTIKANRHPNGSLGI